MYTKFAVGFIISGKSQFKTRQEAFFCHGNASQEQLRISRPYSTSKDGSHQILLLATLQCEKKGGRPTIPARVHWEADAMCGTITAFSHSFKPGLVSGSSSKTSRPHLKSGFCCRCSTKATSSMTGPRDALISKASFFIKFSLSLFMRWVVFLSRLQCRLTTCTSG